MENKIEEVKLEFEEIKARLILEEISDSEFEARKSALERRNKSLSNELKLLKEALDLLE